MCMYVLTLWVQQFEFEASYKEDDAGVIPFTVEKDVKPPIYVYYTLDNFYQNDR